MGFLRVVILLAAFFGIAYTAGRIWRLKPETRQSHVVHRGEVAVLSAAGASEIWLAADREQSYPVQAAIARRDDKFLKELGSRNAAFPVAVGTRVKVLAESSNKRRVEVLEGPQAGRSGWVVFEYLRVPRADEA